jgi:hypothetical protein
MLISPKILPYARAHVDGLVLIIVDILGNLMLVLRRCAKKDKS